MTRFALAFAAAALLSVPSVASADGKSDYETYCVTCHGATGKGDGAAAAALDPKPRDFSDAKYWETAKDADVKKVIKEGGAAVGKSPLMAAWGAVLDDAKIDEVVKYIKSFAK